VSDVAAYTRAHEMQGKWRFLTGSLPQLKKVWRHYHVYVAAINGDADHQPAMVLIGTTGREHKVYMTQMSYEGVGPQAQVLANDIAKLLPGTAAPAQEVSPQSRADNCSRRRTRAFDAVLRQLAWSEFECN
jgi:hypothetical protein